VSGYKVEQRRVVLRGREFHFVSYEPHPANERRGEPAVPAMWCLMNEGHRREVMPHVVGQDPVAVERALRRWVETNIFAAAADAL
jgi:hypothetical protein